MCPRSHTSGLIRGEWTVSSASSEREPISASVRSRVSFSSAAVSGPVTGLKPIAEEERVVPREQPLGLELGQLRPLGTAGDRQADLAAARDDAGERLGSDPPGDPPRPALLLAQHAPVALGLHGPGACQHGVGALAQAVEDGVVAFVAERAGAAAEGGAAVDAGYEVDCDVWTVLARAVAEAQPVQ